MRAVLARMEACEPQLHATYALDGAGALAAAAASERRWRDGQPLSPLDGVPCTVKERSTRPVPSRMV